MSDRELRRHTVPSDSRYPVDRHRQHNISRTAPSGGYSGNSTDILQNYAVPLTVMLIGIAVLAATFIAAAAGAFAPSDSAAGINAPDAASGTIFSAQPISVHEILRGRQADRLLASMTDEEKAGQLLLLRSHDIGDDAFCREISSVHAGGVVLFAKDIKGRTAEELTDYIARLQEAGGGNMLVCVDEEGGTVVRVSSNRNLRDSSFLSPRKLYDEGGFPLIGYDAHDKAQFLRQFGFNVNFAPVADVVTSPDAMMYSRALGLDASMTSEYVRTVVAASESEGVATCLKHFPGYGNTAGDTHNGIVTLTTSADELRQNDLLPFAAGMEAGCGAVMITHTVMSAIDPDRPASLSPAVISLLRDGMGFEGVIVSDGMDMGAIKEYSGDTDVCVTALLAGVDLMCTPSDGPAAHSALMDAVKDGTVSRERLDEAVRRILLWKLEMGLYPEEQRYFAV